MPVTERAIGRTDLQDPQEIAQRHKEQVQKQEERLLRFDAQQAEIAARNKQIFEDKQAKRKARFEVLPQDPAGVEEPSSSVYRIVESNLPDVQPTGVTRRDFLRALGLLAGTAALGTIARASHTPNSKAEAQTAAVETKPASKPTPLPTLGPVFAESTPVPPTATAVEQHETPTHSTTPEIHLGTGLSYQFPVQHSDDDYVVITTYFPDRDAVFHQPHNGIDIAFGKAPGLGSQTYADTVNKSVIAPVSGRIEAGENSARGKYVFVINETNGHIHKFGSGHLSQHQVSDGQIVEKGQVVGLVGSTGASIGPHVHFDLEIDGKLEDPLSHDLIKATMSDNQRVRRLEALFSLFDSPLKDKNYGQAMLGLEQKYGARCEMVAGAMFSDTTLAKNLTTKNNPGNVGNNDRGDRIGFATMEEGIEAVYQTLCNEYLGHWTRVGELSTAGQLALGIIKKPEELNTLVYATDHTQWNYNVTFFLQKFYGIASPEFYTSFPFRTASNESQK